MDVLERRRAASLEVHRLPDAACLSVPLLALELVRMIGIVDPQGQAMRDAERGAGSELEGERRVAALVVTELHAIEPGGRPPVRCADDQEHPLAAPRRGNLDRSLVPTDVRAVGYARQH